MNIIYIFIYIALISSHLFAQNISQEIILGADKSEIDVEINLSSIERFFRNNTKAKKLEDRYHLVYKKIKLGEYYAISISPIESIDSKQSLTILLKPLFPKLFFIDKDIQSNKIKKIYIPTPIDNSDSSIIEISDTLDQKHLEEYISKTHMWLEKWHVLIILLLLGGFFYYRKRVQIKHIKKLQTILSNDQEHIENRINERP